MKNILSALVLVICFTGLNAQKTRLTLDDAVLRQWMAYPTETLKRPQFIPGTADICAASARYDTLFRIDQKGSRKLLITKAELEKATGAEMRFISEPYWVSATEFHMLEGNGIFSINLKEKSGKLLFRFPEEAMNLDYHSGSGVLAYTMENRLYVASVRDARQLVAGEDQLVSGQSIARQEFGISKGTFWSQKGDLLAYYQKDESQVAEYPLLDITTTPGQLVKIRYPMAGQSSEQAFVCVFNPTTGESFRLKVPGPRDQYLTNVVVSPDAKHVLVALVNREQNHMKLQKYDAATGDLVATLLEEQHPAWVEPEHPAWFIPGSGSDFLWMSEKDGYMHLYRYTLEGKLVAQVTKGPMVVDEILGLDKLKKNVLFMAYDPTGLNRYVYAAPLDGSAAPVQVTVDAGVHNALLSPDGAVLLDMYSSLNVPHVAGFVSATGKKLKTLVLAANPLDKIQASVTELVTIKAADGKTDLNARIIKPSNFDPSKKYPVLVYVYGGPHAQMVSNAWLAGASMWMHWLAEEHGFIVFTVDNRGSAHRGRDFEQVIHRQLGTNEVADQMEGVKYLKNLPYVDADRMAVHGWSFGGFMTISLMLREAGAFKVGVAGGPVTDWKYYEVMYGERYMDKPDENPEGYKTARLHNYVGNLKGDLLLIHGTIDDVVVEQHNLSLVQAFIEAGVLVDYFPYPMHPHNVRGKDRAHLMKKVLTFVVENLN
jgi:dipeptidyl-peptidase-4